MTLNLENAFWSKYPPHMQMSYVNLTVGQMGFSYVFVYFFYQIVLRPRNCHT